MTDRPAPAPAVPQIQFQRAHKSALGLAFGILVGGGLFLLTAAHVALGIEDEGLPLGLLYQYFHGYSVSWPGAFIGLAWGFPVGFIAGWMLGFVHNFTLSVWLLIIRTKRDLTQTSNFLDHI